ncbi:PhaM family polyhydroxyalkanoate granule multifunctional regulatory protein [Rhodocyclus tenuis]|uniref:Uncharacterized protein n=1 Tax=Rhodocyclus tenuis TaxID=1066 RepID=A0A840G1U4_RHOTE|nr:PhaM family polyhydroxyalkanoate granule multifunctional regulatory protein [Rhodocyclus tenuis]MBB4245926.1 hypothetical protein [Rhodocyclus tenuis]
MSADPSKDPIDFVRNFWGAMGFSLPGMVTPTFDVDELGKRINDLKAVEGWLKMNLSMLQMTIQSLEMQCVTLNAVRTMSAMASGETADKSPAGGEGSGSEAFAQAALWPWHLMQQMQENLNAQSEAGAEKDAGAAGENSAENAKPRG